MQQNQLYDLGLKLVSEVASNVISLAQTRELGDEIGTTGAGGDQTKYADQMAEDVVKSFLSSYQTKIGSKKIVLIAEETGITTFGDDNLEEGCFIILDTMDGSNNLRPWRTPSPSVSVSVALGSLETLKTHDNFDAIEVGIVRDVFNHRTYIAQKGQSSQVLEYGEIAPSPINQVNEAIVGIDFDVQGEKFDSLYQQLGDLLKQCKCQRRIGSSILDFMKVASGEYDAFVTLAGRMKIYDVAAAQLIIYNSSGVCEFTNDKLDFCLIKELINTKNNQLLNKYKFKAIAGGNQQLVNELKNILV